MHRGFSEMTAEHIRQTAMPCRLFIYVTSPCPAEGPSLFLRKCVECECVCEGGGRTEQSQQCRKCFQSGARQAPVCPSERSLEAFYFLG